jgi:hypothetical protein
MDVMATEMMLGFRDVTLTKEGPMIRMVAVAALTGFVILAFPTYSPAANYSSAAKLRANPCDTSKDCPAGSRCKHTRPNRPGVCVGTPTRRR